MDLDQLKARYKTIRMTNLRKGKGKHAKKNVVDVTCKCGKKQIVATSDLHLKLCVGGCGEKLNRAKKGAK